MVIAMAYGAFPGIDQEHGLLRRYLGGQLDAETLAWFEAWLLTRSTLIELLEIFNDARDERHRQPVQWLACESRGNDTPTIGVRGRTSRQMAAARDFCGQQINATTRVLGAQYRGQAGDDWRSGRCSIEEVTRTLHSRRIRFTPGTDDVGTGSDAEDRRPRVTMQRIVAHATGQIEPTDGQYAATCCRIHDAIARRVTIAGSGHHQYPVLARQPGQRARQHAGGRIPGAIESEAQRDHVGAFGYGPRAGQFDGETVAVSTVLDDLGNQQASVGSNAVATAAVEGLARTGDDSGTGGAVTVGAAILNRTGTDESDVRGNPASTEIGMLQIDAAVDDRYAHPDTGGAPIVETQRLGRKHARTESAGIAVVSLPGSTERLGRVHAQALTPSQTQQRCPSEVQIANEDRSECRHEQGVGGSTAEAPAQQILDELVASRLQRCRRARRQR
jgi:hypothetical protein